MDLRLCRRVDVRSQIITRTDAHASANPADNDCMRESALAARHPFQMLLLCKVMLLVILMNGVVVLAAPPRYEIGSPQQTTVWVDPVNGDDGRSGATRALALRSVIAAWNRIPPNTPLTTGFRILLTAGTHTIPGYWENRKGTFTSPITIENADTPGTVILSNVNVFGCSYLYFINLSILVNGGDGFHCEQCDHLLLRGMRIEGSGELPQETVKLNQSTYVYIENSDISGAWDNAVDSVGVQYGHMVGNRIHGAQDWCAYVKGGSAHWRVENNEFYSCGTGGFTTGQGTGYEFMSAPWIHYEAYDIRVVNNFIHDTQGAGLGVNGGFNILMAYNTLLRTGSRSHAVEFVFGLRSCDGDGPRCTAQRALGGWGPVNPVQPEDPIPNRNVYFFHNLIVGLSGDQHFAIYAPRTPGADSNVPSPARTDQNLVIRGNWIWNGPANHPLGIEGNGQGCTDSNPTCNAAQLRAENSINTLEPRFDPYTGHLLAGVTLPAGVGIAALPMFTNDGRPAGVPTTLLDTTVTEDFDGNLNNGPRAGAFRLPGGSAGQAPSLISLSYVAPVLTVNGSGFNPRTLQILVSGGTNGVTGVYTLFFDLMSTTQVTFTTTPMAAGTYQVAARNGEGGAQSNILMLNVGAAPTLAAISPNPAAAGPTDFTLTGTGFDTATAQVEIAGAILPNEVLTVKTATQLGFNTTLLASVFPYTVAVRNGPVGAISNTLNITVNPSSTFQGSHFVPIAPCRASDTRPNNVLARDSFRNFTFTTCGVPANATAVALNVTLVPSGPLGFLTIWPAGRVRPTTSLMNSLDGRVKANASIIGLGTGNAVSIYVTDAAHIVLDVNGYFVPAGTAGALAFYPVRPCRVVDTRNSGGIIPALGTRRITDGCLVTNAQAYSLNVTVVPPAPLGYLSLWPDGTAQPNVSTLNNLTGTVVANAAILRAGTGGAFNAFVTDPSHFIADLNGYFAPPGSQGALAFYPSTPCRLFDTRNPNGTFGGPAMAADSTRSITVPSSRCGIPAAAQAYVMNATVVPSGVFGFLTLWPADLARPTVSTLNAVDGALTSNAAIVPASFLGGISFYTSNATHMLLDVNGYFAP